MEISVSSWSFQQYIRAGKMTHFDCLAKAKELGFSAIEFTDLGGETPEEQKEEAKKLRAEADRLGMKIIAYTIGANLYSETAKGRAEEVRRLKGQVDIARILGAGILRHDFCYKLYERGYGRSFDQMLPVLARSARQVTKYAQRFGIRTCTENHGRVAQDSERVERIFNAVHHDNYGLLVDIGNFACVDEDSALAVSRVAPYAIHVHVKDMYKSDVRTDVIRSMTRGGRYIRGATLGEGAIPVKRCLRILMNKGPGGGSYDGYLTIEYEGVEDCLEGIAKSRAYLENVLAELTAEMTE